VIPEASPAGRRSAVAPKNPVIRFLLPAGKRFLRFDCPSPEHLLYDDSAVIIGPDLAGVSSDLARY